MRSIALVPVLLAGCVSHTAQIAASANDARAAVGAARGHLDAAMGNLDTIERAAADVHQQIGFVSDDINPLWATIQWGSVAVSLVAIWAIVSLWKKKP